MSAVAGEVLIWWVIGLIFALAGYQQPRVSSAICREPALPSLVRWDCCSPAF